LVYCAGDAKDGSLPLRDAGDQIVKTVDEIGTRTEQGQRNGLCQPPHAQICLRAKTVWVATWPWHCGDSTNRETLHCVTHLLTPHFAVELPCLAWVHVLTRSRAKMDSSDQAKYLAEQQELKMCEVADLGNMVVGLPDSQLKQLDFF
jgi:hypothetical protein